MITQTRCVFKKKSLFAKQRETNRALCRFLLKNKIFCDTMKKRSFPQGEKENCEDAMDSHKKVEGVKKVKFWLTLLLALLSASLGLKLGPLMPKAWRFLKLLWKKISAASVQGGKEFWAEMAPRTAATWAAAIFALIVGISLVYFFSVFNPKRRKKPKTKLFHSTPNESRAMLWIWALLIGIAIGRAAQGIVAKVFAAGFAVLTIDIAIKIVMVLQDVYVKRNSVDFVYFENTDHLFYEDCL